MMIMLMMLVTMLLLIAFLQAYYEDLYFETEQSRIVRRQDVNMGYESQIKDCFLNRKMLLLFYK